MIIMQGDSYPIYMELTQDGAPLTPDMVAELEVCVGDKLRKLYSAKEVFFDEASERWYIHPTQEETFGLEANTNYDVTVRIRYKGTSPEEVMGMRLGQISVRDSTSEAVI